MRAIGHVVSLDGQAIEVSRDDEQGCLVVTIGPPLADPRATLMPRRQVTVRVRLSELDAWALIRVLELAHRPLASAQEDRG